MTDLSDCYNQPTLSNDFNSGTPDTAGWPGRLLDYEQVPVVEPPNAQAVKTT